MTTPPQPVTVTGGAGGVAADLDALRALGGQFGAVADHTLGAALSLHRQLIEPALLSSALLDPVGAAEAEAALAFALDGPGGLTWAGTACGALDVELRAAAAAYEAADRFVVDARDVALGAWRLPGAIAGGAEMFVRTGNPLSALQVALARDPELADDAMSALGIPALLRVGAGALPDGHGVVRHPGVDNGPVAARPPRSLADVLVELDRRDDDPRPGAVDVRILTLADGARRAIVDISGTKSWTPLPTSDVTSLTTNERALVGRPTAYEGGVLAAMRHAGVRPTDDVMIVGHSQGGMVAVNAARDAVARGEFRVTHVITAGSPIGRTVGRLPRSVQVLALENRRDVVPHLDGVANPDRPNVTTVESAHGDGTITGDHDAGAAYVPLARDAEASSNRSIRHFLATARGYFQGRSVVTHTYQIQRSY